MASFVQLLDEDEPDDEFGSGSSAPGRERPGGIESKDQESGSILARISDELTQPILLLSGRVLQAEQSGKSRARAARVATILLILSYLTMVGAAGYAIYDIALDSEDDSVDRWTWIAGTIFVLASSALSFYDICMHVIYYVRPRLQRYYVRIIWMVPLYAIQSWLALYFPQAKVYLETPRDAYEAYVIYSFYVLMLESLGSNDYVLKELEAKSVEKEGGRVGVPAPYCCIKWKLGEQFLTNTSVGVFQYVFIRLATTVVTLVAEAAGVFNDGVWSATTVYSYVTIVLNFSQIWALYMLAGFYLQFRRELGEAGLKPLGKFATIKAVVFFSWWQGVAISVASSWGWIHPSGSWGAADVAKGLQDFLICLEAVGFAWAHHAYFGYRDFRVLHDLGVMRNRSSFQAMLDIMPFDVVADAKRLVRAFLGLAGYGYGYDDDGKEESLIASAESTSIGGVEGEDQQQPQQQPQPAPPHAQPSPTGHRSRGASGRGRGTSSNAGSGGLGSIDAADDVAIAVAYAHTVACGEELGAAVALRHVIAQIDSSGSGPAADDDDHNEHDDRELQPMPVSAGSVR